MIRDTVELTGSTDVLSLFDLAQLLSVNEATGLLQVKTPEAKGYLYFHGGAIINALDDDHREGEEAATRVFALGQAEFSFVPDLPSVAHRITCPTQNLIMEIARQLDEESEGEEATRGQRLREIQSATAELNAIFTRLDSESQVLAHRSHESFGVLDLLHGIRDAPGSTLFLRESAAPTVLVGGRMIPLSETPLDRRSYEDLRDHLRREARDGPGSTSPRASVLSLGEEGDFRLELFRYASTELLTVQHLPRASELWGSLPWPTETLDAMAEEPGSMLLITGATSRGLDRAFESACHHFLTNGPSPFLGLANRWHPQLADARAGAVLLTLEETPPIAAWIELLHPEIVALEDAGHRAALGLVLRGAERGSRTIVGVCSPDVSHVPARLLGAEGPTRLASQLGFCLTGVLSVDARGQGHAWAVDEACRRALRGGDPGPLADRLRPPETR